MRQQQVINADDYGDGIPIIFIHPPGMGRTVFSYQRQLSAMYRIILPDLSGHGDSKTQTKDVTIDTYVEELRGLLDSKGIEKAVVCGYSAASMVAQQFVIKYPNRTQGLILSGGFPKVDTMGLKIEYTLGMKLLLKSPRRLMNVLAKGHTSIKEFKELLISEMEKNDTEVWYKFYHESLQFDCTERLQQITCPTLLMYGNRAFWINAHKKYYETLPNCECLYVNGAFHQLPTKHFDVFNANIHNFIQDRVVPATW